MTWALGARRMEGATLTSIAVHLAAAIAIPALAWSAYTNTQVETVSFTHVTHAQIFRPRTIVRHARVTAPRRKATPALNFAHGVSLTHLARQHQATRVVIAANLPAAPAVAAVTQAGDSSAGSDAAPTVSSSPKVRAVASTDAHPDGGYLPFGAEQPTPVLDPAVRKQLDALGAHVTLIVTVGDDGRTTNVLFQPPIDPQLENRIRSLLADANWDPAVCGGGVSCEGQATLRL